MSKPPGVAVGVQIEPDPHVTITGYWVVRGGFKVECESGRVGLSIKEGFVFVCTDRSIAEVSVMLNEPRDPGDPEFEYDPVYEYAGPCEKSPGRQHYKFRAGMTEGEYAEGRKLMETRDA